MVHHMVSNGYTWGDIEALHATRRIHVLNGVIFAYTNELELIALPNCLPNTEDPRYSPSYGNVQSASEDPRDANEAVRQAQQSTNAEYAAQAKKLLADAQQWLDDPAIKVHYGAANLLRYGTNQSGEWRNDYGVLVRADDVSYQWPSPSGAFYVLIVRNGQIVSAVREYPERLQAV